jgi:hypothetical protein
MGQELIDLSPSPSSLIESLRDIGYSMQTAVADILDNSITAQATEIDLRFSWNSANPWLGIIDDGYGMSREELIAAMRFGSISPAIERSKDDLGRFGLGMKTASFSQCRHLTVLSKKDGVTTCCEWNLDLISNNNDNRWMLQVLSNADLAEKKHLSSLANDFLKKRESGTIVLWEKIDRIDKQISEVQQETYLNSLIEATQHHLELVFHRYLSPEVGKKKLRICLNGKDLEAFDPFNSGHPTTIELPHEHFECQGHGVSVQPFVLPHHNKIDKEQYQLYAGKEGYVQNQGFYVYRNRRLIIKGTWFRLIKKAELTKLVRVRIDIPNTLDHLWKIDVKKSNASPPESIRTELKRIISKIECSGKRVYEQRGQRLKSAIKTPAWERRVAGDQIYYEINRKHPLVKQLMDDVKSEQSVMFSNLLKMFEGSFPVDLFFSDFASSPEKLQRPGFDEEQLSRVLEDYIEFWGLDEESTEEQVKELLQVEPFSSNKELMAKLLAQKGIG